METTQKYLFDRPDLQPAEGDMCSLSKDRDLSGFEHIDDQLIRRSWPVRRNQVIEKVSDAGLPRPGEHLTLVTMRKFSAIEFLDYIIEHEHHIRRLAIVVYSISRESTVALIKYHRTAKIDRLQLLISNIRNTAVRSKEEAVMKILREYPEIDLFFANSHAKVFTCETAAGNHYTLTGSGNLGNST